MKLRDLIFLVTRVKDGEVRGAIAQAWAARGQLAPRARCDYPTPEIAKLSREAMLAWVLFTMAQDEPKFFAAGVLAILTLPIVSALTLLSTFSRLH